MVSQQNDAPDEAVNDQPDFTNPSLIQVEGCNNREEKAYDNVVSLNNRTRVLCLRRCRYHEESGHDKC